jgi:peptidase MA superfamily protein/tetratricopeptide repeat protein
VLVIATLLSVVLGGQAVVSRTAVQWTEAGWQALRAGQAEEAARDFDEALRLDARSAIAMLGAGAAAQLRGKTADARQDLVGALRLQPSLTAASLLLGEILYREADLQGAIAVYEQALLSAPSDPQLNAKLEAWRREAAVHDRFSQRIASHFTIMFEGPPDQPVASRVAEMLEGAYWRIGGALGAYPRDVVPVILYSKEEFRDVTQSPRWAGGLFDGRIRVPVGGKIDERELERVLSHELTHAIVYGLAPRGVPQWLNEGLAVLFERGTVSVDRTPLNDAPPIPLTRLERSFQGLSSDDARLAYVESALATQKAIDLGGPTAMYNLLTNIASGMSFATAFERAVLIPYAEFLKTWAD